MNASPPHSIVGIGASAGGLYAYRELMGALPTRSGMAFVIVSHLHPTASSHLAQLLSKDTTMPVTQASHAEPIQANHVYVIPANADLFIERGAFRIVSPRRSQNNQVDLFLTSLAEAMQEHAIGIIFSGYDSDGTTGCKHIKSKGGITFAQDESAIVRDMPLSAQSAGYIDFVLSPGKIGRELRRIGKRLSRGKISRKPHPGTRRT